MKKRGILNQELSELVAGMGHTDMLVIADAGLPILEEVQHIDLALTSGVPPFLKTLKVILEELEVQEAVIAEEMQEQSPELYRQLCTILDGIPISQLPHETFKLETCEAKGIVRTGECTPFANVILISGVTF